MQGKEIEPHDGEPRACPVLPADPPPEEYGAERHKYDVERRDERRLARRRLRHAHLLERRGDEHDSPCGKPRLPAGCIRADGTRACALPAEAIPDG